MWPPFLQHLVVGGLVEHDEVRELLLNLALGPLLLPRQGETKSLRSESLPRALWPLLFARGGMPRQSKHAAYDVMDKTVIKGN